MMTLAVVTLVEIAALRLDIVYVGLVGNKLHHYCYLFAQANIIFMTAVMEKWTWGISLKELCG